MKRGESGLSLLVAVNKPAGMTSHDIVNRCRRIFGERRVGHTGTLDPLATGVLPICVGPATRLGTYLTAHDKRYRTIVGFGFETDTDDIEGERTITGVVAPDMLDGKFAAAYVGGLVGPHLQVPPHYSAIKKNGKKAYELARAGQEVRLEPRPIEVYQAVLVDRYLEGGQLRWVVDFSVSKGTYIRALVRDMGRELGCYAHVVGLERRKSGTIALDECVSLDTLKTMGEQAALDPVRVLGYRLLFADDKARNVENGGKLSSRDATLYEFSASAGSLDSCACTSSLHVSSEPPVSDERVSIVVANRLKGIYRYDECSNVFKPDCIFSIGVARN